MRFEFLVVAVAAGGVVMGTAMETLLSRPAQTFAAAQAPAGTPTKITFSLADLNPLRLIYDAVMDDVTSGQTKIDFPVAKPLPPPDFSYIARMQAQYHSEFDPARLAQINGENLINRTREMTNRQQDMLNFARDPAGWHGMPPH